MRGFMLLSLLLLLLPSAVLAAEPDRIISNSADWQDVYSVMLLGSLTNRAATFLVSDSHSVLLAESIPQGEHLWVISSPSVPYRPGYGSYLEDQGFTSESFTYDSVNLALAGQFNTTSFVIVDDSYGYNAISVAPYAVASGSWVFFADEENIDEVTGILDEKGASSVLIYGHVDRAVTRALAPYNPEVINQNGDRFANNVEIVKRFQAIAKSQQAILTNGEFIEQSIMAGREPVVFIGRNNVPEVVREYIAQSDITIGVLVGNELVNTATFIRRQIGISVFVKFARSSRGAASAISQVEALDAFYLPTYQLNLAIEDVTYNRATGQLEVTMQNTQDQAAYFIGTYTLNYGDGRREAVGDAQAVFIEPNSFKTLSYLVSEMNDQSVVDAFVTYGESRNSLEFTIDEQFCLGSCTRQFSTIDVIDNCHINMSSLSYSLSRNLFYAEVANLGEVGCFVDVELQDVIVAAERVTYQLEDTAFLEPGEARSLRIRGALEEEDLEDNPLVDTLVLYGQRENSLIKTLRGTYPLLVAGGALSAVTLASYAVALVILGLAGLLLWRHFKK